MYVMRITLKEGCSVGKSPSCPLLISWGLGAWSGVDEPQLHEMHRCLVRQGLPSHPVPWFAISPPSRLGDWVASVPPSVTASSLAFIYFQTAREKEQAGSHSRHSSSEI